MSRWVGTGVKNQGSSRADDWSFIGEQWWSLVADTGNRTILPPRVHHRYLGLCVISQVASELKSGDLCSPLGDKFRDYRQQLIPRTNSSQRSLYTAIRLGFPLKQNGSSSRCKKC